MRINGVSVQGYRAAAVLLGLIALAGQGRADEDMKAIAKVAVEVTLELSLELKKDGFPVAKDSLLGDAKVLKKAFAPHVGAADAKKAAACYAWGLYFVSIKKKAGQQVLVTLFTCKSPKSAKTMIELMTAREAGINKAMEKAGIELGRKKLVAVKVPNTTQAYAYERVFKPKGEPEVTTIKLVVASGRYVVEVALVGSKDKALVKRSAHAVLVGLGLAKRAEKKK